MSPTPEEQVRIALDDLAGMLSNNGRIEASNEIIDNAPAVLAALTEARAERDAALAKIASVVEDLAFVEAMGVRKPDRLSDWGKGVTWMLDRIRVALTQEGKN